MQHVIDVWLNINKELTNVYRMFRALLIDLWGYYCIQRLAGNMNTFLKSYKDSLFCWLSLHSPPPFFLPSLHQIT